jgi:GT2 family glycosyltransferase
MEKEGLIDPMVYVVIPVFQRSRDTIHCLDLLKRQTYSSIQIVVSDGGSKDNSVDEIRKAHPEITLLTTSKNLWWGEAIARGIDFSLRQSVSPEDFVLMLNDDTEFDESFIATLVMVSRRERAAVGAMVVDSRSPNKLHCGGVLVDWQSMKISSRYPRGENELFFDGIQTLSGRASLVPIHMIQTGGNVNAKRLPHYISDYEFFCRLKRIGFRIGITYETKIAAHLESTGLTLADETNVTVFRYLYLLFSRRSKNNLFDHLNFILLCAPRERRVALVWRTLRSAMVGIPHGPYYRYSHQLMSRGLRFLRRRLVMLGPKPR